MMLPCKQSRLAILAFALFMLASCANAGMDGADASSNPASITAPEPEERFFAKMILITLESDAHSDNIWSYVESEEGIVSSGSTDEYYREDAAEKGYTVPEETAPGTVDFVFVGLKEGKVTLSFTLSNPEAADAEPERVTEYVLRVRSDKTIEVLFDQAADGPQLDDRVPGAKAKAKTDSGSDIEGRVTESLSGTIFKVELENGNVITASLTSKLKLEKIKITTGDTVKVTLNPSDLSKGEIIYRYK